MAGGIVETVKAVPMTPFPLGVRHLWLANRLDSIYHRDTISNTPLELLYNCNINTNPAPAAAMMETAIFPAPLPADSAEDDAPAVEVDPEVQVVAGFVA